MSLLRYRSVFPHRLSGTRREPVVTRRGNPLPCPHAVAAAAADVADQIGAAAIVAFTASGTTALRVARKRPKVPIVSLSPESGTARQLALLWGAHSMVAEDIASYDEMVDRAPTQLKEIGKPHI